MTKKFTVPLADYQRITRTVKAILDSEDANTARSCQFFAMMGAAILDKHYRINCKPVFGASFVLLDETRRNILSYGRLDGDRAVSSSDHYHAWVDTGVSVIDFMAPLYGDAMQSTLPRWMLQRQKNELIENLSDLTRRGDSHFVANADLTEEMLQYYLSEPLYCDLIRISTEWYRKPPGKMAPMQTRGKHGSIRHVELDRLIVDGAW